MLVILLKAVKTLMEEAVVGEMSCRFARCWSVHEVAKADNFAIDIITRVYFEKSCTLSLSAYCQDEN